MKRVRQIRLITAVFYSLVVLFVVVIGEILIPFPMLIKRALFPFIAVLAVVFFLLGLALVFLAIKTKIKGKYGKFLILTGASSVGFFVSVLLHNFLYGLGVITRDIAILHYSFEFLHAVFFIIAVIVCPLGFLVGAIGSIVTSSKRKK